MKILQIRDNCINQNSQLSLILQIRTLGFPMNSDLPKATGGRTLFYNIFSIFRKWCLFLCTYITAVRLSECHLSCFPLSHLFSVSTVSLCVTSLCSSHSLCFPIVLILSLSLSIPSPSIPLLPYSVSYSLSPVLIRQMTRGCGQSLPSG